MGKTPFYPQGKIGRSLSWSPPQNPPHTRIGGLHSDTEPHVVCSDQHARAPFYAQAWGKNGSTGKANRSQTTALSGFIGQAAKPRLLVLYTPPARRKPRLLLAVSQVA
jgi:hypothetical protein